MLKKLLFLSAAVLTLMPMTVRAENRSYYYEKIDATITVNPDSTLSVEERQTHNYTGLYRVGWRSVSLDKLGSITDEEVWDGGTGKRLTKLFSRPVTDATNPTTDDFGKYVAFTRNGARNIEWYYNMENTTHTWILKYKIHGAIEFGKNNDRLYYNIFTNYDVPVKNVQVKVIMPTDESPGFGAYRTLVNKKIEQSINGREIMFSSTDFAPREALTIDLIFPKNIITKTAFWKDWLKTNYGYVGGAAIILLSIIIALIRWIVTEIVPKGRGTIVPQYAPPQDLPPAMAELIVKEKITQKTWPATLVDLAVRGFVKIEEDKGKSFNANFIVFLFIIVMLSMLFSAVAPRGISLKAWPYYLPAVFVALIILTTIIKIIKTAPILRPATKNYVITKIKTEKADLRGYERKYLEALFRDEDTFSTKDIKWDDTGKQELQKKMREAKKELLEETESKTDAFHSGISREKYLGAFITVLLIAIWLGFFFLPGSLLLRDLNMNIITLLSALTICAIALFLFFRFEARLSQKGREMKEEWLGFKMYLEVAEKYRLQNLTPDLFEKYLPYAMIFGVEKKWAKNFEAMHLPAPDWYRTAAVAGASGAPSTAASFSPSAFSASFTSSFSSSFSSSSGGGGGGGGGSAGGGGGGGGGGAR